MTPERAAHMVRPHIQRSALAVISREAGTLLLGGQTEVMQSLDTTQMTREAHDRMEQMGLLSPSWGMAQLITLHLVYKQHDIIHAKLPTVGRDYIPRIYQGYTYQRSLVNLLTEAMTTQHVFPVKLAHEVACAAHEAGVPGFAGQTLEDIGTILRRPDLRQLVDQSATTSNGVWEDYSTAFQAMAHFAFGEHKGTPPLGFVFDAQGQVSFSPAFAAYLKSRIRKVNQSSPDVLATSLSDEPSGGCPARRLHATFNNSETDQQSLRYLSGFFSTTPETLLRKHDTTVINDMLDVQADIFTALHRHVDDYHYLDENARILAAASEAASGVPTDHTLKAASYVCELSADVERLQ